MLVEGPRPPAGEGLLVIDAANVVGSRPDWRWWTDRAGAARRLHDTVATMADRPARTVLVLEGRAREGLPPGWHENGTEIRHGDGDGDDEVVSVVREAMSASDPVRAVCVVTADRELRRRVTALGATTRSPGWLWSRTDYACPGGPVRRSLAEQLT